MSMDNTKINSRVPKLRFPEFVQEWEENILGAVSLNEDNRRRPVSRSERVAGEYPYYGANGIQDYVNQFIYSGERLLIGEDGSVLTEGGTPVLNWATGEFWVNNHAHVLSQKDGTSLKYLYYYLSTVRIPGLVTGIPPKLTQDNLNSIRVLLPPSFNERKKLAECLSAIDELIYAQGQKVDALKARKKGLMQQLFPQNGETTPSLRFPGFNGEWEVKKLVDIAQKMNRRNRLLEVTRVLTNSANDGVVDQSVYFDRDIAVKGNTDNYYIVELDDFVYNPRISSSAPVGPISINKIGKGIMSPLYTVFKFHTGYVPFFEYYFQTNIWHPYLKSIANFGARFDRMNITSEGFFDMPLYLPSSLAEQQKIASCLSSLDDTIQCENDKLETLKAHKKGLMQQLFPNSK